MKTFLAVVGGAFLLLVVLFVLFAPTVPGELHHAGSCPRCDSLHKGKPFLVIGARG